jgi:hypothetical protein
MLLRNTLLRFRWVVLILPAFALFSSVQVGCGNDSHDDFSREDLKTGSPNGSGYGYGYGDDDDGYGGYGYE